jgi:hypothetical protein
LFFGGAIQTTPCAEVRLNALAFRAVDPVSRRRKTKRTITGVYRYKRATPPGFEPHPTDHVQFLPSSAGIGPFRNLPEGFSFEDFCHPPPDKESKLYLKPIFLLQLLPNLLSIENENLFRL